VLGNPEDLTIREFSERNILHNLKKIGWRGSVAADGTQLHMPRGTAYIPNFNKLQISTSKILSLDSTVVINRGHLWPL
jgi:hypothetical protein